MYDALVAQRKGRPMEGSQVWNEQELLVKIRHHRDTPDQKGPLAKESFLTQALPALSLQA